ncbi:MAG: DUF5838 family protein [Nostoc sp.]
MNILPQKLQFISKHEQAFEIKNLNGLELFKSFVAKIEKIAEGCFLEAGCKVKADRIYFARFSLGFKLENTTQLGVIIDFFDQINSRIDVDLNYSLIDRFLTVDSDISKISKFMFGVDLRRDPAESSLDIGLTVKDYPEKQELAINLYWEESRSRCTNIAD